MKNILLFLLISISGIMHSQNSVKGTVKDTKGHLLDAVTITLTKDQKQIATAFSDLGDFSLNHPEAGNYTLTASLSGYQPVQITLQLPKEEISLVMQKSEHMIEEVTMTKRKPLIERKIDRISFHVENSIIASGGSAWEALSKAPGVQVTSSNTLTANRKNVRIYLDGKPLTLSGDDLAAYLQGMPSDQVAQIEIFSNPPARFDAEGASVINIITKKSKKQGLTINLSGGLTQGSRTGYTGNTTFNYRKNKWNMYGSYGFTRRNTFQDHNTFINYGNSLWNGTHRTIYASDPHAYRLGIDYQVTDNQLLGFLVTGNNRKGSSQGSAVTRISRPAMKPDSLLNTDNYASTFGNQYTYNLNYNLKLDSAKSSLNIDLDYSPFRNSSRSFTDNVTLLPDGSETSSFFHIYTPSSQDIDILSGKADYHFKASKGLEITSGIKYSSTKSTSIFDYFNRDTSVFTAVEANSNHFIYRENVASFYTSASGNLGSWTVQGGLRGEFTRTNGYLQNQDLLNKRNYFKLFPTLFVQYRLNDSHELQLNYAYRIERPEYNRLNPAKRFSSPYIVYAGNPALRPAFVHSLEAGYTYKQKYNLTAYYTSTRDVFTNIEVQDNKTQRYYGTQANLGLSAMAGMRLSAQIKLLAWWDLNLLADVYRQREKSEYLSGSFDNHMVSFSGSLNQSFSLDKGTGLKAEINATYNSPGIQGVYTARVNSQIDAGIKMNILKNAGTLRLTATDIFNTNNNFVRINYQDQQSSFFYHRESRFVTLSLQYRLGKNITASRNRTTASEEERKRAL
ncbi:TonB-dependent receptor [Chryseobacterium sp. SSA4.19]|uniref:TonB-dependent receptor domain-containing protein n=1 Tax=Chryseobacterium sp. SSA4.19 TaxID=2919915 RepID=UPI001F4D7070|nr:TonB-dependent receptor [Chryseobacterium sp. SSA4.19]MCJ8153885.1 TonB-dependent receptor [Chryseobacterium sp. SSA4.19]